MTLNRRDLLKASAGLGAGLAAPAFLRSAHAQTATVRMLSRSHFLPAYEGWLKSVAASFERETGIRVVSEHIAHPELGVRYAAEISSRSGHDVVELTDAVSALPIYEGHLADVTDVADQLGSKHGGWLPVAEAYCKRGAQWKGILNYYQDHGACYRKDLIEKVGASVPETWLDLLKVGKALKAAGHPCGLPFSRCVDATAGFNELLWAFDAPWVAEDGKKITVRSAQTKAALEFAQQLYQETMTPEVLSWDDAGNNRFMISGRGSWTMNAPSVYWTAMKQNAQIGANIFHDVPLKGPKGTRINYPFMYAYGIWNFSPNVAPAKKWLTYLMNNWMSGYENVVGYNYPPLKGYADAIVPVLEKTPNLARLKGIPQISRPAGYPGPMTVAVGEVTTAYVIPDMFVKAANGEKPDAIIDWAERQLVAIYSKRGG